MVLPAARRVKMQVSATFSGAEFANEDFDPGKPIHYPFPKVLDRLARGD